MSPLRCIKGFSLVEVLIAVLLITVGLLGLLTLQPTAWRSSTRSDYTGRAAMILQQELETHRAWIMNAGNPNPTALSNPLVTNRTVYASGQTTLQPQGDLTYTVTATTTDLAPLGTPNSWRVVVLVTWPGNSTGITDSVIVGRQLSFMWPPL
jgi:type IV pilus modification protein PilV